MKRIMVLAVSGLGWSETNARLRRGELPALASMVGRGTFGALRWRPPYDGPAPWVSLATGVLPEQHDVYLGQEAWAGGLRPIGVKSWQVQPIWRRLADEGLSTASVAWPASRPGDSWPGEHIDDSFITATGTAADHWALPLHCAPAHLREALRGRRLHPTQVDATLFEPLAPHWRELDQARDSSLAQLAVIIAEAATTHSAAMFLAMEPSWEVLFVHYNWLGAVKARFANRAAPLDQVVAGAMHLQDAMLANIANAAGEDCLILLAAPGASDGAGVVAAAGPGIAPGSTIRGADLLDIAPTVLARFGFVDGALAGRAIAEISARGVRALKTFPDPVEADPDPAATSHLTDAGYASPPPPSASWRIERLMALGHILLTHSPDEAEKAASAALRIKPDHSGALALSAAALIALRRSDALPHLAEALDLAAPQSGWSDLVRGAYHALRGEPELARPWLSSLEVAGGADMRLQVGAAWLVLSQPVDAERIFSAVLRDRPHDISAALGLSMCAVQRRDLDGADVALKPILDRDPSNLAAYLQLYAIRKIAGRSFDAAVLEQTCIRLGAKKDELSWAEKGFGLYMPVGRSRGQTVADR